MVEKDFEGSLVLEKLARIDRLEEFLAAVDSDNFTEALALMRMAQVDEPTIALVLKKMADEDDEH